MDAARDLPVSGARHRTRMRTRRALLLGPGVLLILAFLIAPLAIMAVVSFQAKGQNAGVDWGTFSLNAYIRFFFERDFDDSWIWNGDYLRIFFRSFLQSGITTLLSLAIGLPTALWISRLSPRDRNIALFLVTIPFWSNLLVRNYAWILMLRSGGLADSLFRSAGLLGPDDTLGLLYTDFSVSLGLTYSFLPFMVLPIYASLEKLDWRLVEAGYDLGANRWQVLKRIILPLSKPGIMAGAILVFVPCLGAFVTPTLLGGGKTLMIGNLIQNQFGAARDWPFGSALAFVLLMIVGLSMALFYARRRRAGEG